MSKHKTDNRYKEIGGRHRAMSRYYMILYRTSHIEEKKNSCYANIKMLIEKEEFIEWFMKNDFEGASVDRIDKTKDYTIDNIQTIPLAENIRKDKLKPKDGFCECCRCKKIKPLEEFVKSSRSPYGYATICKECERIRCRNKKRKINNRNDINSSTGIGV